MSSKPAVFGFLVTIFACSAPADVALFSFPLADIDSANQGTINQLFIEDFQASCKEPVQVAPESLGCSARECALANAAAMGAKEAVYGSARKLGSKWIISGYRCRVPDGKLLASVRLNSQSIEDFEFAMKRTADALAGEKTIEEAATIDNVTENEMSESQHRRRQGFYAFGLKFGYLFPVGKKSYRKITEHYDYDYLYYTSTRIYDTTQYRQVLSTDVVNWFELPKDLVLDWDLHIGWGAEFGSHFALLKLFSRNDFTPYAGGGIGMDYVFPGDVENSSDKRNSGFALNGRVGMLLFRTYDFRLSVDGGYKIIFNDDMDQGVTANIGITWKKRSGEDSGGGRNPFFTALAIIGGIVVTVTVISLFAVAN
jgi:hypothetical protein